MFEASAVCDEIALPRCIFPLGLDELVECFIRWCSTNPRVEFVRSARLRSALTSFRFCWQVIIRERFGIPPLGHSGICVSDCVVVCVLVLVFRRLRVEACVWIWPVLVFSWEQTYALHIVQPAEELRRTWWHHFIVLDVLLEIRRVEGQSSCISWHGVGRLSHQQDSTVGHELL